MRENEKQQRGDIEALKRGDYTAEEFTDWDNPEDFDEDAPEGYYDDDEGVEFEDGSYVPGPGDPDYDLSEQAGYSGWEAPAGRREVIPQWVVAAVSIVLILSFVGALFLQIS